MWRNLTSLPDSTLTALPIMDCNDFNGNPSLSPVKHDTIPPRANNRMPSNASGSNKAILIQRIQSITLIVMGLYILWSFIFGLYKGFEAKEILEMQQNSSLQLRNIDRSVSWTAAAKVAIIVSMIGFGAGAYLNSRDRG